VWTRASIAEPGARARLRDRRTVEDQRHRLATAGECAADQLVALVLHLRGDRGEDTVDVAEQRSRAGVEHRDQIVAMEALVACGAHPGGPGHVLAQTVGAEQRVALHATAHDVAG
jgi:hypothetical protein